MWILDLTVSVKPKKVVEWKYFILIFSCKQPNGKMSRLCGVKLNLKNYYLHDKMPNESIVSMLSIAKMLK